MIHDDKGRVFLDPVVAEVETQIGKLRVRSCKKSSKSNSLYYRLGGGFIVRVSDHIMGKRSGFHRLMDKSSIITDSPDEVTEDQVLCHAKRIIKSKYLLQ